MEEWIGRRATLGRAFSWVLLYAGAYAAYCMWLHLSGHSPSAGTPFFERSTHYRTQAILLLPISSIVWIIFSVVSGVMARALGGRGSVRGTVAALGPAWALPMLFVFVIPDAITFGIWGFEALPRTMRIFVPLTIVSTAALCTWAVRLVHAVSWPRAFVAAFVGGVVMGALHGPWLR